MTHSPLIAALLQDIVLPPGFCILLMLLALLCRGIWAKRFFLLIGMLSLYATSIPATALWLNHQLQTYSPPDLAHDAAEAIVVLCADRYRSAPEYAGDTLYRFGLERSRYAAWLHKQTGLPILVSGGSVYDDPTPEAELMKSILTKEFGVEVRWVEGASHNTLENAQFSSRILKGAGIGEVFLVTQAWHMPRAVEAFEQAGLKVVPAPTGFVTPLSPGAEMLNWAPTADALLNTEMALHEVMGRWWYRYKYYVSPVTS